MNPLEKISETNHLFQAVFSGVAAAAGRSSTAAGSAEWDYADGAYASTSHVRESELKSFVVQLLRRWHPADHKILLLRAFLHGTPV